MVEGYNLTTVRDRLYESQRGKCAYCERPIGKAGQPTEHFRPKRGADRGDPFTATRQIDEHRYWWLAWSWNNLLLSCATCNSQAFKGNRFPLAPGSVEVAVPDGLLYEAHPAFAVGLEQGLLVDPSWDDPLDHITWRPLDPARPFEQWRAMHRTERGRVTIKILGLDGRNVDRAGDHVQHVVRPWVERIVAANSSSDVELTKALWNAAITHLFLFAPAQMLQAISHDALDYFIPADVRSSAALTLPRPGHFLEQRPASTTLPISVEKYRALPEELALLLLAKAVSTPEQICQICLTQSSTLEELVHLLGLTMATVRRHCEALIRDGKLTLDAASGRYEALIESSTSPL